MAPLRVSRCVRRALQLSATGSPPVVPAAGWRGPVRAKVSRWAAFVTSQGRSPSFWQTPRTTSSGTESFHVTSFMGFKTSEEVEACKRSEWETRRLDQRVVFDASRWLAHRSSRRFNDAFPTWPMSSVMLQTMKPVLFVAAFTTAICAMQLVVDVFFFHLPTSLFALSGPTLGLLLVFRTNASYERWDGARKMIGLVKNRSEDLVRQTSFWFPADRPELKEQMVRYIQAFFFALKVHLRSGPGGLEGDEQLVADLTPVLQPAELETLLRATNRPAHILQCMTAVSQAAGIQGGALMCMDHNLTTLADVLGGCERILRTPIPLNYTRMTTRFLLSWLLILPLALSSEFLKLGCTIWLTPPCMIFLAFLFLGIDEVAVQIEEPFTILPMEAYAEGSRKNTAALFSQLTAVQKLMGSPAPPPSSPRGQADEL